MKKFICALIACSMIISLIACSSDGEKESGTSENKDTQPSQQTAIVTDENGVTSVVEVTDPAEDSTDVTEPSQDEPGAPGTDAPVQTDKETEKPEDETTYPIEKNPIEDLEGMALVNAAYKKMNTLSSYEYGAVVKMNAMDEEVEYTLKTVLKEGASDIEYLSEVIYAGEVAEGMYHKNGYTYQTIDGVPFKGKMTKAEFEDYLIETGTGTSEYTDAFRKVETEKTENGAVVTLSDLDAGKIYNLSDEELKQMGAVFKIKKAEGKIVVDKAGHIVSEHISISIDLEVMGMKQGADIEVATEVKNVNSVGKISFPALDGYEETPCIAGLYRLTKASEAYDAAMNVGMTFELDKNVGITGSETVSDIMSAECEYSYQTSLMTSKIILDLYSNGTLNGEAQELSFVSDGKNITMVMNGEENKGKYDEDIVWTILSEALEYALGYASFIDDISEKKANGGYVYEFTVDEEYGYYFIEKAVSYIENEIDYEEVTEAVFESINCEAVLDKNGELAEFTNEAVFSFTMKDGSVYNVNYKATVRVNS